MVWAWLQMLSLELLLLLVSEILYVDVALSFSSLSIGNLPGAFLFGQNGVLQVGTINDNIISDFSSSFGSTIRTLLSIGTDITGS